MEESIKIDMKGDFINLTQLALQSFDKDIINKDELEMLLEINFETGEFKSKSWKIIGVEGIQILMQLCDKTLITKEVFRKQAFGLDGEVK